MISQLVLGGHVVISYVVTSLTLSEILRALWGYNHTWVQLISIIIEDLDLFSRSHRTQKVHELSCINTVTGIVFKPEEQCIHLYQNFVQMLIITFFWYKVYLFDDIILHLIMTYSKFYGREKNKQKLIPKITYRSRSNFTFHVRQLLFTASGYFDP